MKKVLTLVISLIIFLTTVTVIVYADDCLMGRTPDGGYPMASSDIVMQSEDIYIDVEKQVAKCNFQFKNTGLAKDIIMGFPAEKKSTNENTMPDNLRILNFRTTADGKDVPVKLEKDISPEETGLQSEKEYTSWYTFVIHFESGETKKIDNTYDFVNTSYSTGDTLTGYIINTGAYWKDKIGHAKVYFNMGNIKPYMIIGISPNQNYRFDGTNIVWEYSDFEPEQNLKIMYNSFHHSSDFLNAADSVTRENIKKEEEYFDNIDNCIKENDLQKLQAFYNQAAQDNKPSLAEYIRESMGGRAVKDVGPAIISLEVEKTNNSEEPLKVVRVKAHDNIADFKSINIVISHMQDGKEMIDNHFQDSIDEIYTGFNYNYGIGTDFTPGIEYKIHCEIKDWNGNGSVKDIKYKFDKSPLKADTGETLINTEAAVNKVENGQDAPKEAVTGSASAVQNSKNWAWLIGSISAAALGMVFYIFRKRK